ncbi:hypothetical protein JKP88DRAFT_283780 [Tribonema minus]|uniref:Leucine-rich repeat domain-containing protein n=1 Tax=Tribonema minus TaxID=303371 RepID=A0A835YK26_9STRA|nr:hypothetical protein JKP88DRAFT_283780 [Tribonema minus]
MPAYVLTGALATKTITVIPVDHGLPRGPVPDFPDTIRSMTLFKVRSNIGPLPKQLDSLTFTAALVWDGTPLTSALDSLPESLRVLKLDAVSDLMDIALLPRLATLRLCGVRRLGPLPASLTSILLEHCWLPAALQLPRR